MQSLNNIVKLLPAQIPQFWELIKHITVKVDEVDERDLQLYLLELLHALLNDSAQCFVGFDDKKAVTTVLITRLMMEKITGVKYLFIQNMYSFRPSGNETREKQSAFLKEFARREQCVYIFLKARHERIWELAKANNFEEDFRAFKFRLEN